MRCMVKRLNLTLQSKNKMIPGQPLIYERANGVVYARYRDPPIRKKDG